MEYDHTQKAPIYLVFVLIGIVMGGVAQWMPVPAARLSIQIGAGCILFMAPCFRQLTLRDEGHQFRVQYGPLPLFHRLIPYSSIHSVAPARIDLAEGWGIHLSPSGGWTWNLWGWDCVDLHYGQGKKLRVGTDDPEALLAFLQKRIEA